MNNAQSVAPTMPEQIAAAFGGRVPTPTPGVKYPCHPLCLTFPSIPAEEQEEIIETMKEDRILMEDIVLLMGPKADGTDDMVLDGRHRQDWCFESGVTPRYRYFGSLETDGTSPTNFVYWKNTHRRNTVSQSYRSAMANELQKFWLQESEGKHPDGTPKTKGEAITHAAKTVGVSETYIRQAETVEQESPDDYEKLKTGAAELSEVAPPAEKKKAERKKRAPKAEKITASNPAADLVRKNLVEAIRPHCGDEFADKVAGSGSLTTLDEMDAFGLLEVKDQQALVPLLMEGLNLKFARRVLDKAFDEKDRFAMAFLRAKANGGKPLKLQITDAAGDKWDVTIKRAKEEPAGE